MAGSESSWGGVGVGVLALVVGAGPAAAQELILVEPVSPGATTVGALNADGSVMVGRTAVSGGSAVMRWTAATGAVSLGDLPGGRLFATGQAVSADGSIVAGAGAVPEQPEEVINDERGFYWTSELGLVNLGNDQETNITGMSSDGRWLGGNFVQVLFGPPSQPFRWSRDDGFEILPLPPGYTGNFAIDFSGDGQGVAAQARLGGADHAAVWRAGSGWTIIPPPPGYVVSRAQAISWDGSVVFGVFLPQTGQRMGFRWTASAGVTHLFPPLGPEHDIVHITDCSADGSVAVGWTFGSGIPQTAVVWDAVNGLRSLLDVATSQLGLTVTGYDLSVATAISADGNVVGGSAIPLSGPTRAFMITELRSATGGADTSGPSAGFSSPLVIPHPGDPAPEDGYTFGIALLDPNDNDLPIDVTPVLTDPSGIAATSYALNGAPLEVETWAVSEAFENPFVSTLSGDFCLRLGSDEYTWAYDQATPSFAEFGDGLAALAGQVRNVVDPDDVWDLEIWFEAGAVPAAGPDRGLLPGWYVVADGIINPGIWRYYAIETAVSVLRGREANVDQEVVLASPSGTGMQVGMGASNRNLENGATAPLALSGDRTGAGTLALNLSTPGVRLTRLVFAHANQPALGAHTVTVSASDAAGNVASATQAFDVALQADFANLWVLQDSLADDGAFHLAALVQMGEPATGHPSDPLGLDMVVSTMVVEDLDSGTSAPVDLLLDLGDGTQLLLVERDDLRPPGGGPLGANFRVTGRFYSPSGPAFVLYHYAP